MAGTINLALTQQFDMDGEPLSGGLLYFFAAGSTTPQNAFQDSGLTIAFPNPIVLDASGRVPMFYLASTAGEGNPSGQIKIRLADESGVTVVAADQLLIIGPAGGSGGGGAGVDPATIMATGDIKARYGTGPLDGFCRCNGLTIGKTGSGATERAADLCQALFEYLWQFQNAALDGSTFGASANADWLAGKKLILPDLRGRVIAGMDDMGATAANRLTAAGLGVVATVLANVGASQTTTLTTTQLPAHTHAQQGTFTSGLENALHAHAQQGTFTSSGQSLDHTHAYTAPLSSAGASGGGLVSTTTGASTGGSSNDHTHSVTIFGGTGSESAFHAHDVTISGLTTSAGSGAAFSNIPPTMVLTMYIKM